VRVSVAVTVRNDRSNLEELLRSLAAQTTLPDELVVVDARSADGTFEAVETFAQTAPFPVVAVSEPCNRGQGRSRCVQLARGDLIAFIDSDCVAAPDWLARFVAAWERERVADAAPLGALGAPSHAPPGGTPFQRAVDDVMEPMEAASFHGVNTINCVYSREAVLQAGLFDAALHTAEDPDLNARLAKAGWRLARIDNPCVHKRRDTWRALTRQHFEYGKGGSALQRRHPEYFPRRERWMAPLMAAMSLAGLVLAWASPWFLLLPALALVALPLAVHRRLAWRFLRAYGPGPAWWRRLGVLWTVFVPYQMGVLVGRVTPSAGAR
jgi:glycosyltransferase involved in cell wall biosynthesis